ncbi:hypothetical protein GCM10010377_77830 [Streptomyces viridiviolaceus]|uniref:Sel1 repeat family protein n=1 Tax=Streptomyces viridiviolaceus TaxID=68282 RepID=A0ABW2E117_9ACTN|nr:hypothetical protein [Streptomyces viridiviolaceus]GHB75794.1 hypothetical protein GCM10010377_77830 [Streptomyces viridiviolaceus]
MTAIDQLLARARLHPQPDVPDDTIPYEDTPYPAQLPDTAAPTGTDSNDQAAARHLYTLCETAAGTVTPDTLAFLTDQVPDLHSAWLLGCTLHLAGIEDGARFWWQYAAGDGHAPACYTLALHHLARGEHHAAAFYHRQAPADIPHESETLTVSGTCPPRKISFDSSLSTVLRILTQLSTPGQRRRPHRIDALTNYVADTVTRHYIRNPSIEIPVPEPRFADRVGWLLTATLPWRSSPRPSPTPEPALPTRPAPRHPRNPATRTRTYASKT